MDYLAEKIYGNIYTDWSQAPPITFQRFAKVRAHMEVAGNQKEGGCMSTNKASEVGLTEVHARVGNV